MRRLVLWDIDGTIMSTGGVGRVAFQQALEEFYGDVGDLTEWTFAGKTDPQICQEILMNAGVAPEAIAAGMPRVIDRYLDHLEGALASAPGCHLKPGVSELIETLASDDAVVLGLLTGNVERGARLKLERFGLWPHFRLGAYGSDHAERKQLPAIAVERAEALVGRRFAGKEVVIIGDTEHDIRCGESLGVTTVAVATGVYGAEALAAHGPDHLFNDFADLRASIAAIRGEAL